MLLSVIFTRTGAVLNARTLNSVATALLREKTVRLTTAISSNGLMMLLRDTIS
jgi:hypothetical protein